MLSAEDIIVLKNYIEEKHKQSTNVEKAKILANAVHRIVDKNLPDVDISYRINIRQKIINKAISSRESTISKYDIFDSYISIADKSNSFFDGLVLWINQNVKSKVTNTQIQQYYKMVNSSKQHRAIAVAIPEKKAEEKALRWYRRNRVKGLFNPLNFKYTMGITAAVFIVLFNLVLLRIPNSVAVFKNKTKPSHIMGTYLANGAKEKENKFSSIPDNFKYKNINRTVLKKFLLTKKSLLGVEPYFSNIISVAKEYNVNPLLLFAIAGQEQGFVPRLSGASRAIVNNPFNVYHSWKAYNTNLKDATKIVCATLINLCKDRPKDVDALTWINRKYAEDRNWAHGVSLIYNSLENYNNVY